MPGVSSAKSNKTGARKHAVEERYEPRTDLVSEYVDRAPDWARDAYEQRGPTEDAADRLLVFVALIGAARTDQIERSLLD